MNHKLVNHVILFIIFTLGNSAYQLNGTKYHFYTGVRNVQSLLHQIYIFKSS